MATKEKSHPEIILRDEDAVNKLEVLIYNLLSVGQWETARGNLLVLANHEDGQQTAKHILKSIIFNPKVFW